MNGFYGCDDFSNCFQINISWSMKFTFDLNTLFLLLLEFAFATSYFFLLKIDFFLFSSVVRVEKCRADNFRMPCKYHFFLTDFFFYQVEENAIALFLNVFFDLHFTLVFVLFLQFKLILKLFWFQGFSNSYIQRLRILNENSVAEIKLEIEAR